MSVKRILGLWHQETSFTAVSLLAGYQRPFTIKTYVFEAEGILKKGKLLSDGSYYNTVVMGKFHD
ncbi:hypothetical protein NLK52_04020 [Bacillus subtilis]|nr:hypothetical protein [Bacillus subtilis]AGI28008.1 GNAT family acetyltransferase [Bacillus subtilis subsp. subtilis str. BAB-1]MCL9627858.1 hypothetical protein [Bacillus subtilis]UTI60961.1 hypothetical protein NLK52_04020 [Bacillus subtilis]UXL16345.1 hypothetical protein N6G78_04050 [Bacillus subtilis]